MGAADREGIEFRLYVGQRFKWKSVIELMDITGNTIKYTYPYYPDRPVVTMKRYVFFEMITDCHIIPVPDFKKYVEYLYNHDVPVPS